MHTPLNTMVPLTYFWAPINCNVRMGVLHSYSDGQMVTMAHYPLSLKNGLDTFNACMCLLLDRPVITIRLELMKSICITGRVQQLSNAQWTYSVTFCRCWPGAPKCSKTDAWTDQFLNKFNLFCTKLPDSYSPVWQSQMLNIILGRTHSIYLNIYI